MNDHLIWVAQGIYEMGQMEDAEYWVPYARGMLAAVEIVYGKDAKDQAIAKVDEWQRGFIIGWRHDGPPAR